MGQLMDDPLDREAEQEHAQHLAARELQLKREEASDTRWLMSSVQGRRWAARIMDWAGVPTGDPFSTNGMKMAQNVGRQDLGQRLLILVLEHARDQFTRMWNERDERNRDYAADDSR